MIEDYIDHPFCPDVVFVVSQSVWDDFTILRNKWELSSVRGFYQDCSAWEKSAIKDGDLIKALHWRAVSELAARYSNSPLSAIEIQGQLFREIPAFKGFSPIEDSQLERLFIGVDKLNK